MTGGAGLKTSLSPRRPTCLIYLEAVTFQKVRELQVEPGTSGNARE